MVAGVKDGQLQLLSNFLEGACASVQELLELAATGSTISTKGAQGRQKLQQELAQHKGIFFDSVLRSMARRMQPARPADLPAQDLALRGVTPTAYVERYGGFGRSRDLGCLMWQVAMLLDHLQMDNLLAAKDSAALLAVCLEQAALDNGRMDIGLLLSLGEDPPAGVFQNKAVTSYARGRRSHSSRGDGAHYGEASRCHWRKAEPRPRRRASQRQESCEVQGKRRQKRAAEASSRERGRLPVLPPIDDEDATLPETSSVPKLLAAMPRWILASRAQFAALLARSFFIQCRGQAPASVVFPPLMDFGLFKSSGLGLRAKKWSTLVRKRALHVIIVALNFLEGSFSPGTNFACLGGARINFNDGFMQGFGRS